MDTSIDSALQDAQKILKDAGILDIFTTSRQPSWKYYQIKGTKDMAFYTSEKANHKGKPRYISGIYKYKKGEKAWIPRKQAGHAKKRAAIARARKLAGLETIKYI